jgi:hypothetical protein
MLMFRKTHNIILATLSLFMFIVITFETMSIGKFGSIKYLLCSSYNSNTTVIYITNVFLYSKYIEWFDTLFLHLSDKRITMLQYTHHMTTVLTVYVNMVDYVSPMIIIPMGLNCLVHIPMYWYFAFPKGIMYKFRQLITISQIIQHIIVIVVGITTMIMDDCQQNKYGNKFGVLMYFMYLFYFGIFYIKSYLIKNKLMYLNAKQVKYF